jgi:hypothetical protein
MADWGVYFLRTEVSAGTTGREVVVVAVAAAVVVVVALGISMMVTGGCPTPFAAADAAKDAVSTSANQLMVATAER